MLKFVAHSTFGRSLHHFSGYFPSFGKHHLLERSSLSNGGFNYIQFRFFLSSLAICKMNDANDVRTKFFVFRYFFYSISKSRSHILTIDENVCTISSAIIIIIMGINMKNTQQFGQRIIKKSVQSTIHAKYLISMNQFFALIFHSIFRLYLIWPSTWIQ